MDARGRYTPTLVRELLAARRVLDAVPDGEDYDAERERLTRVETALMAEGWRNWESAEELERMAAEES